MAGGVEPLAEVEGTDDAEVVVVAFGTPGRYVKAAVRELRGRGGARWASCARSPSSRSRPRSWPTPPSGARAVAVYENNQGQMIDDVRLAVLGPRPVRSSAV